MRDALVHHSPHHDFFFSSEFSPVISLSRDSSVSLRRRIEFIQKVLASHFSLGILSMLLPSLLPSIRRYSGLVHASLIISGRPAGWRAEKATNEEYRYKYQYFVRTSRDMFKFHEYFGMSCTFHSYFSKPLRARMRDLAIIINSLERDSLRFHMKLSMKIQSVQKKKNFKYLKRSEICDK